MEITLVDRRNFHVFRPLSYQVATGALSAGEVAYPLRAIFKRNLVGFQNRMLVFIRWSFSFATRGRGARLISGPRSSGAQPD